MFYHMEEKIVSPNSFLLDAFLLSSEINIEDISNCQDPPNFDWISSEDPNQGYVTMEFATLMQPSIPKVEAHAFNESTMSEYCMFAQAVPFLPTIEGFDADLIWKLNKVMVTNLMDHVLGLSCMLTMCYGAN